MKYSQIEKVYVNKETQAHKCRSRTFTNVVNYAYTTIEYELSVRKSHNYIGTSIYNIYKKCLKFFYVD